MELKEVLKAARNALAEKQYDVCIGHCQSALKLDKRCILAFVMAGKAAAGQKEYVQAEKAYSKAIALDPDNAMGHQVCK